MLHNIETKDFYLAAFLVAAGIKLQSHQKINGSTIFSFTKDDNTSSAIDNYYSMSATDLFPIN